MTSIQRKDGPLCHHRSGKVFWLIFYLEESLEFSILFSVTVLFLWTDSSTPCFLPVSFPLSLEVSDLLKISEPLTCLFTAIENSGSTGNTMKNLKKKMRRLPRLPHLNSDPTTNTEIPGTYFHPVRDRFWPAAYISFCRCFWHSVPCRKLCIFLCFNELSNNSCILLLFWIYFCIHYNFSEYGWQGNFRISEASFLFSGTKKSIRLIHPFFFL